MTMPDGTLVITCTGVVSGDTLAGTVDLGELAQAPSTGVRVKRRSRGAMDNGHVKGVRAWQARRSGSW
jgi:hypothetical protein